MIEVEGLPEGYVITKVTYNPTPQLSEHNNFKISYEKIKTRRIVLEETNEIRRVRENEFFEMNGMIQQSSALSTSDQYRIWREVKGTDLSLNSEEPKLSLSVDECKDLMNPKRDVTLISRKIQQFIKENS